MTPQFLFAPMFGRHVMSDSAASYGAHNRVVAGNMACNASNHSALQAARAVCRRKKRLRCETGR
jgi:hypothetical protein